MGRGPGFFRHSPRAFSLIELLLTVALVGLLLGAAVYSLSPLKQGAELDEGASRFESLLRFARAHAANTGRKVQLVLDLAIAETSVEEAAQVQLTWEPDPLGQPWVFTQLPDRAWGMAEVQALVRVETVQPLHAPAVAETDEDPWREVTVPTRAVITFYPDGSSDSAEIILVARDLEDTRRVAVQLNGITGTIRRATVAPLEDF